MDLCNLDQQVFVCGFLETMKEGLEISGLAESCVLLSLRNMSPFLRSPDASKYIEPMVNKLMDILQNSDEDLIRTVGFHDDIGFERSCEHLPQFYQS
jgi:hypothetical protein